MSLLPAVLAAAVLAPVAAPKLAPALEPFHQSWDEQSQPTAQVVTPAMREADVAFLEGAMPTSYAGFEAAARAGFDWSAAFAKLRKLPGKMSVDAWQSELIATFSPVEDHHLGIQRVGAGGSLSAWAPVAPRPERRGSAPRRDRSRAPTDRALADGVHVLELHDFFARDRATWQPLRDAAPRLRAAKILVIDLRGNGGGDDDPFYRFLVDLTGQQLPTVRFKRLQTPLSHLELVNVYTRYLATKASDQAWQERSQRWHDYYLKELSELATPDLAHAQWDLWNRALDQPAPAVAAPFKGKIVALVDRACASACELALKTLKSLPDTVVVGEPTAGMAVYGDNFARRMPGSGLAFFWGHWQEVDLANGAFGFREGHGFTPDLMLGPDELSTLDGDEALRKLVDRLAQPKA